jgi:hypothetical protein
VIRLAPQQVTFAAGEISALLHARVDYIRHRTGLKRCRGFIPLPEGVATRAPGTEYLGRVRGDGPVRLIDFVFRDDDSYMLEFTPLRMRVWRDGAPVTVAGGAPYELTTPYDAASLGALQTVQSADRVYLVDGRNPPQRLSRFGHASWAIEPTPFRNGPFAPENLDEARTVSASAAVGAVTLTGVGGPFAGLSSGGFLRLDAVDRAAVPTWTGNQPAAIGNRMAYDGRVYEIVAFDAGGTTTGVNPPTHAEGDWLASKGGPVWRMLHAGWGVVRLDAVATPDSASATVIRRLPDDVVGRATRRWSPPAWGATLGWPRAIAESDQRLIYGGTAAYPRGIWASRIGDPIDFERGIEADDAFAFNIAAARKRLNAILWIEEGASGLHIGTSGGTTTARPTDTGLSLGPTTTTFLRGERKTAAPILPEVVDGEPVFVSASRRKLHGLQYRLDDDRVRADEISQNARHILSPGVAAMAWQEEPWRVLWFALADGELAGLTLYAEQQVFAFHRHALCGGKVRSLAVKPTADGAGEELWLAVERQVEGQTRVFVERMAAVHFEAELDAPDPLDAWHQCAAIRWSGAASATIPGLGHLVGQTVTAWTDQGAQTAVVAAGGVATLAKPATRAIVGLCPCVEQRLRTLPLAPQGPEGGQDGKTRRIAAVGARLLHTVGGRMRVLGVAAGGRESVDDEVQLARAGADPFAAVRQWSGVADYRPGSGWSDDVELEFLPAPGAPLTVAALTPALTVGGG